MPLEEHAAEGRVPDTFEGYLRGSRSLIDRTTVESIDVFVAECLLFVIHKVPFENCCPDGALSAALAILGRWRDCT